MPKSQIRGQVYIRRTQQPLAGVRILVPENGTEEVSTLDGGFSLPALPPGTYTLETHLPGFVVEQLPAVEVVAGRDTDISIALEPAPLPLDEIVVTPSQVSLLRSDPDLSLVHGGRSRTPISCPATTTPCCKRRTSKSWHRRCRIS